VGLFIINTTKVKVLFNLETIIALRCPLHGWLSAKGKHNIWSKDNLIKLYDSVH